MAMPGMEGLLEYGKSYAERLRKQLLAGFGAFAETRQPAHLVGALNPTSPLIQDAALQAGGLLAPQVNALSQSLSQGSENLGLGPLSIPEVTGEQLAPFLMLGLGGRNKMGFYSPSGKALTTAPGKGQSGQYLAHLKKEPGAIREAKETGLLQALEQAPGTLTKEEVVSMWNPIELDETVRAGSAEPQMGAGGTYHHSDRTTATKYGHHEDLNLPGGSNPKEILVQLPEKVPTELPEGYSIKPLSGHARGYKWTLEGPDGTGRVIAQEEYEDALNDALTQMLPRNLYKGGHWSEPNVLAHIRTNERDVGGKKALHIEEIQSDWHQRGQKKGYVTETGEEVGLLGEADYDRFYAGKGDMSDAEWEALSQRVKEWDERMYVAGTGVPDAPYKKDWHELAFKRTLMEAINDPSIERLTWTTGAVQADRYNLAKYIDSIEAQWSRQPTSFNDEVPYDLAIINKDGESEYLRDISRDELENYVGKEMAQKIIDDADGDVKTYSGLDLEVGGEFHKNLYDKKITQFAKKFLKKYGVEPKRISETDYRGLHTAPQPEGKNVGYDVSDIFPDDIYSSRGAQYYGTGDASIDVPTINLIKEMKGNPSMRITVYRAVPRGVSEIREGDWVTINPQYAEQHGAYLDETEGGYEIISKEVEANSIFTDGNSIHEWGYWPFVGPIPGKGEFWYIDITPQMRQDLQQKGVPLTMTDKKPLLAYA